VDDTFQVVLLIINISHHAPIDIFLRGRDPQDVGHEFKGGIMLEISKFP
jgi:hypothetical protein